MCNRVAREKKVIQRQEKNKKKILKTQKAATRRKEQDKTDRQRLFHANLFITPKKKPHKVSSTHICPRQLPTQLQHPSLPTTGEQNCWGTHPVPPEQALRIPDVFWNWQPPQIPVLQKENWRCLLQLFCTGCPTPSEGKAQLPNEARWDLPASAWSWFLPLLSCTKPQQPRQRLGANRSCTMTAWLVIRASNRSDLELIETRLLQNNLQNMTNRLILLQQYLSRFLL